MTDIFGDLCPLLKRQGRRETENEGPDAPPKRIDWGQVAPHNHHRDRGSSRYRLWNIAKNEATDHILVTGTDDEQIIAFCGFAQNTGGRAGSLNNARADVHAIFWWQSTRHRL